MMLNYNSFHIYNHKIIFHFIHFFRSKSNFLKKREKEKKKKKKKRTKKMSYFDSNPQDHAL